MTEEEQEELITIRYKQDEKENKKAKQIKKTGKKEDSYLFSL